MAGLLNDVFGAPVIYQPKAGSARPIHSVFREEPVDLVDVDGHPVRSMGPTWRVERQLAPELGKDDLITLTDGRVFEVRAKWPSGSPADDAFFICDMFQVEA